MSANQTLTRTMSTTLAHISFENWSPHARFASRVAERLACKLRQQEQLFTNRLFPLSIRDVLFVDPTRSVHIFNKSGNIVVIDDEEQDKEGGDHEERKRRRGNIITKLSSDYLDWARWSMKYGQAVLTGDERTIRTRAEAAVAISAATASAPASPTRTSPPSPLTKGTSAFTATATGSIKTLLGTATTPREAHIGAVASSLLLSPSSLCYPCKTQRL